MFKSRAGDGSECVGLIIRTPGGPPVAAIPPPNSTSSTNCRTNNSTTKQPIKLQPRPNGAVPITPKLLPNPSSIPAIVTTTSTTTNVTVTSNTGQIGVGSMIELPISAVNQANGTPVHLTLTKPKKTTSKSKKQKEKSDESEQSSSNTSRSSFDMQSPPQIIADSNFVPSTNSFLPPISSQSIYVSSNGCTADDINAINIAHDLTNEHEMNRNFWQNQQPSSSHFYGQEYSQYPSSNNQNYTGNNDGFNGPPPNHDYQQNPPNNHYQNYHQQNHHNPAWINVRPLQYPNNAQMTSSTPDSGIQSIDGSPPSTTAFTPPMVSPYAVQSGHYDHGTMQSLPMNPHGTMQQSHIQLPPLNCRIPANQQNSANFCPMPPAPYLDNQQPSCSYSNGNDLSSDNDLDHIAIEPMRSISPPALDSEKRLEHENDSDIDYSDMPTLIRADDASKIVVQKDEELICDSRSRAESRISNSTDLPKKDDEIAISANMNADEIANKLRFLPQEKLNELWQHILPANLNLGNFRPSSAKSTRRNSKRRPTPPPSTPPPTIERPLTRSSMRSPSVKKIIPSPKKEVKQKKKENVKKRETKTAPKNKSTKKMAAAAKRTKSKVLATKNGKPKSEKVTVVKLTKSPFSRFHRPALPLKILKIKKQKKRSSKVVPQRKMPKMLSRCPNDLSILLEKTHLNLPKIEMAKWEPSGSWKSCFKPGTKRKMPPMKENVPMKKPKLEKTMPLKITIPKTGKKKIQTSLTPVSRDDYNKIRSNVLTEAPIKFSLADRLCNCTKEDPCTSTSKCISRSRFTECTQYSCPIYANYGECQNQRLLKNDAVHHHLQLFKKPDMKYGVRSLIDISENQLVTEFVGEVLRKETYLKRLEEGKSYPNFAVELYPGSYVIDAAKKGNLSRFMNHSCQPNCVMQRWNVNGQHRIGIFALKKIEAGVELTYDYSMHVYIPNEQIKCLCGSDNCKGVIPSMPPPIKTPTKPNKLSKTEVKFVREKNLFLRRNILKYSPEKRIQKLKSNTFLPEISDCLTDILNNFVKFCKKDQIPRRWINFIVKNVQNIFASSTEETTALNLVDRFDASVKHALSIISKSMESKQSEVLQQQYLCLKRQSNVSEILKDDKLSESMLSFLAGRRKPSNRKAEHSPKILSATVDLTYMDSDRPVGSYDPDKESGRLMKKILSESDGDSVRCICGIVDEGGTMCQCDVCHYWLHCDCLGIKTMDEDFTCLFCEQKLETTPNLDILLFPPPDIAFEGCTYYRTLVNCRGIQARVNECVYTEKIINDEYKKLLKGFNEKYVEGKPVAKKKRKPSKQLIPTNPIEEPPADILKPSIQTVYDRKDLRVFRIVRWINFIVKNVQNIFASSTEETTALNLVDRFDASVKHALSIISKSMEPKQSEVLQQQYLCLKRQSNVSEILKDDKLSESMLSFLAGRRKPSNRKAEHSPKILSATVDLTYMDSDRPVGSYDPDKESGRLMKKILSESDGDSVRCICGIVDEGGTMCQCDVCHYWLHCDCLGIKTMDEDFTCLFCEQKLETTPNLDILLFPPPDIAFEGCTYYRTLVNCRGIQARVNECVYTEKIINDEYKKLLKGFNEKYVEGKPVAKKKRKPSKQLIPTNPIEEPPADILKPSIQTVYDRKDLRVFRIVRLFKDPTGQRFAFGCYYARPHETFVDPGRMFYKNELFCTPLFDTLPVDAIVGRCLVMEPADYAIGRPKAPFYIEDDVFVCEYSIDKTQKQFARITGNDRYPINTKDYLFDMFKEPIKLERNFTPFAINTGRNNGEKPPRIKLSSIVKDTSILCLNKVVDKIKATNNSYLVYFTGMVQLFFLSYPMKFRHVH
uniref:Histone-lysine N-methyltransferase n=1 Tax=Panagrolaimus sp. JU765 TaxID=591449 RepID=A0AC34R7N9_9BILA